MGNLGRAGYGATVDGMWPYTYDSCDIGTVSNQTVNGQPAAATVNGDASRDGILSYLPGQRLSRCTCDGESHPGPKHCDGTYVGRAAPEIDIFEAQASKLTRSTPEQALMSHIEHWYSATGVGFAISAVGREYLQPPSPHLAHVRSAIQPRVHLGKHDRQHVHSRPFDILPQHLHWQRDPTGHFCRNADESELLRRQNRVLFGLWFRIQAWIRQCRMSTCCLTEKSQLILIHLSVYHVGIQRFAGMDLECGWFGSGSAGGDFCSTRPTRADGVLHSHEAARYDC